VYRSVTSEAAAPVPARTRPGLELVPSEPKTTVSHRNRLPRAARADARLAVKRPRGHRGKRLFDILSAGGALLVLSPLLIVTWVLVRLTSPGPGIFWSERVGFGGTLFRMPKFRSMYVEAPSHAREALPDAANHVTVMGAFLRRSSIDELPQLWSVLTGDMSLIGPRPLLQNDSVTQLRHDHYPLIFTVRPGITGLAQVNGRNHVHGHRKVRYDGLYARRCTARMDAFILARTIQVVLSADGVL
jgi:O-antigen biosynthesis protein WbqP